MKNTRKCTWILLLGILLLVVLTTGCGPVSVTQPDGSVVTMSYEDWLSRANATDAVGTQWVLHGTPTFVQTDTLIPTNTPLPTITPLPTATPLFTGYLLVSDQGVVVRRSEFEPQCDEYICPGSSIYWVVNGNVDPNPLAVYEPPLAKMPAILGYGFSGIAVVLFLSVIASVISAAKSNKRQRQSQVQIAELSSSLPKLSPKQPTELDVVLKAIRIAERPFYLRLIHEYQVELKLANQDASAGFSVFLKSVLEQSPEDAQHIRQIIKSAVNDGRS